MCPVPGNSRGIKVGCIFNLRWSKYFLEIFFIWYKWGKLKYFESQKSWHKNAKLHEILISSTKDSIWRENEG